MDDADVQWLATNFVAQFGLAMSDGLGTHLVHLVNAFRQYKRRQESPSNLAVQASTFLETCQRAKRLTFRQELVVPRGGTLRKFNGTNFAVGMQSCVANQTSEQGVMQAQAQAIHSFLDNVTQIVIAQVDIVVGKPPVVRTVGQVWTGEFYSDLKHNGQAVDYSSSAFVKGASKQKKHHGVRYFVLHATPISALMVCMMHDASQQDIKTRLITNDWVEVALETKDNCLEVVVVLGGTRLAITTWCEGHENEESEVLCRVFDLFWCLAEVFCLSA
jgi:hypothetical protein